MLDRVSEIIVAVYSRTANEAYSEQSVAYSAISLAKNLSHSRISTVEHDQSISQVRIDFSRFPVSFYLESLSIAQRGGATVFVWTADYDWSNNSADMSFKRTPNGVLVECLSSEASLIIPVPEAISAASLVVTFSLRGVFGDSSAASAASSDLTTAWTLQQLLSEQEDLSRYLNELQRGYDFKWSQAKAELSRFQQQWTQTDDCLSEIRLSQQDATTNFAQLKELHTSHKADLSKRMEELSVSMVSATKEGYQALTLKSDGTNAKLDVLDGTVRHSNEKLLDIEGLIESQTAKLDAVDDASRQSNLKLETIERRIEAQAKQEVDFHQASLLSISDASTRQIDFVEDQSAQIKLYIRTGINSIRRDIDEARTLSDVQALNEESRRQSQVLENILDSLSNIKQSKGMNIGLAARIMASNYRIRGRENFSETPTDLPAAMGLIDNLRSELLETRGMLETILRSRSWYLTKPLRFFQRLLRRLFR